MLNFTRASLSLPHAAILSRKSSRPRQVMVLRFSGLLELNSCRNKCVEEVRTERLEREVC